MAISILNQLYPPQFSSTFAPAFPTTSTIRIYFSLSSYNSASDIQRVHVSITNQTSNEIVVDSNTGLLFKPLLYDADEGMYYVTISPDELKGDGWTNNQFYKLQLRFDNFLSTTEVFDQNSYLTEHLENFSEWSSVLLLRPILAPQILVRPFDIEANQNKILYFNKGVLHVSGSCSFADGETETMASYRIDVYSGGADSNVVQAGKTVYTSSLVNPNSIDALVDLAGLDTKESTSFGLKVTVETKNGYILEKGYPFMIAEYIADDNFKPTIDAGVNQDTGVVTVTIKNTEAVFGSLYVKRSSSLSDFKSWEMLEERVVAGPLDMSIVDDTVCSGVWYRYSVQLENSAGGLTRVVRSPLVFPSFFDAFLVRDGLQARILFNYKVSSMKPVVNRQKLDTLGGRYPRFVENAVLNYKQFSISGTISSQADEFSQFLDKEEYFGNMYEELSYWEKNFYRDEYSAKYYNDFWERGFREELVEWLNDGTPKLYRSMPEGNMVVMLTDVSLTPNTTLSRRIWDFSATAYEIADGNSLETLDTLGIRPVPKISKATGSSGDGGGSTNPDDPSVPKEYISVQKPGQRYMMDLSSYGDVGKSNVVSDIIWEELQTKYGCEGAVIKTGNILSSKNPQDVYLTNVKVCFSSKPHLFTPTSNGGLLQVPNDDITKASSYQKSMIEAGNCMLGYTLEINGVIGEDTAKRTMFVGPQGYYQIPSDIIVTSLCFPQQDTVTLEYVLNYKETNARSSHIASTTVERTLVGQVRGIYSPDALLGEAIRKKYTYLKGNEGYQKMQWWKGICVDVTPFAVVNIMYQDDLDYNEYLVGETGVLHFLRDSKVQDLYFSGRQMQEVDVSRLRFCNEWQYAVVDGSYDRQSDIASPQIHAVYSVGDKNYLYYVDRKFYEIELGNGTALAKVPITGDINYYGDVMSIEMA